MKEKLYFEVREFWFKVKPTDEELNLLIDEMWEEGFLYEGINQNNGAYSFMKSYKH